MWTTYFDVALLSSPVLAFLTIHYPKMHNHSNKPSVLQYFVVSFVSLLLLRYAASTYFGTTEQITVVGTCMSVDQPNPIAALYPNNATGTLNGTVAVIPISLKLARQLIPPQYGILEHAYRALLPNFPKDMYPAIVQALHDHEVQAFGYKIDDFTRTGIEFPFIDLLNDNTTSFKWAPSLIMSANHEIALKGAADYGTNVYPATFDPGCDAYRAVPNAKKPGTTYFGARSLGGDASLSTLFSRVAAATTTMEEGGEGEQEQEFPYPLSFFKNFTNQPTFADGKTCDNMIRLFNTSVTTSPHGNGIERVKGTVRANIHPFVAGEEHEWREVFGLRMDTAFIENNYLPCEGFRGYSGLE